MPMHQSRLLQLDMTDYSLTNRTTSGFRVCIAIAPVCTFSASFQRTLERNRTSEISRELIGT